MNQWIRAMRDAMLDGTYHIHRQSADPVRDAAFTADLAARDVPIMRRASARLADVLDREQPVILPGERIALTRTVVSIPEILTPDEWSAVGATHHVHELGKVSNVCPDYASTIATGLVPVREKVAAGLDGANGAEADFLTAVVESIDAVLRLVDRYADEARCGGRDDLADVLDRATRFGATTFLEALQVFRVLHYALWASFNYHNTVGRFDLHFWPYLEADLRDGRLNETEALDLVEEFFLTFNRDSDLYPGVQQGDNGQSLVLGGCDRDGVPVWNPLSEMSLQASLELGLVDPKINVRMSGATEVERYVSCTRLTARGLGFPQYSNDDVVIPGLVGLGYDEADARDYVVAACWEFIIPGVGMDIANIAALSFAGAVDSAVYDDLAESASFPDFMGHVRAAIVRQAEALMAGTGATWMEPSPFLSVLMDGPLTTLTDVSAGLRYNNYGIHGTGLSTAADSLAAIKATVFDRAELTAEQLTAALRADFVGHEGIRDLLKAVPAKMGNDDDAVDLLAADLLQTFAAAVAGHHNDRGGVFRAGTGSAMYYVRHAATLGATADGRKAGEYLSANLAPSLGVKVRGPLSLMNSFTKLPLGAAINGGPVTVEVHDTVFRTPASTEKVGMLVRSFIKRGGHQLQINALNRETLLDAQAHPERHRNLIVRVWGWSAYFIELDREYQNQIIQRVELVP